MNYFSPDEKSFAKACVVFPEGLYVSGSQVSTIYIWGHLFFEQCDPFLSDLFSYCWDRITGQIFFFSLVAWEREPFFLWIWLSIPACTEPGINKIQTPGEQWMDTRSSWKLFNSRYVNKTENGCQGFIKFRILLCSEKQPNDGILSIWWFL